MIANASLETAARELLSREWQRESLDQQPARSDPEITADCPILWMLPEFLELVAEAHDQPAQNLAPLIQRLILERNFVDENGDSVIDESIRDVEHHVQVIVKVLEEIRKIALEDGSWSNAPVTPLMFG